MQNRPLILSVNDEPAALGALLERNGIPGGLGWRPEPGGVPGTAPPR